MLLKLLSSDSRIYFLLLLIFFVANWFLDSYNIKLFHRLLAAAYPDIPALRKKEGVLKILAKFGWLFFCFSFLYVLLVNLKHSDFSMGILLFFGSAPFFANLFFFVGSKVIQKKETDSSKKSLVQGYKNLLVFSKKPLAASLFGLLIFCYLLTSDKVFLGGVVGLIVYDLSSIPYKRRKKGKEKVLNCWEKENGDGSGFLGLIC